MVVRSGKTGSFVGETTQVKKSASSSVGLKMQVDRWLKNFDAKQSALSSRQDAFLNKLGVKRDGGGAQVDKHRKA